MKCTLCSCRRSSHQDPVCVQRTESNRAEHSELWEASSPSKARIQKSFCLVLTYSPPFSTCSTFRGEHNQRQYPSFLSTLPSLFLSSESSCGSDVAKKLKPQVSSPHFLGKSEPLPSIQPDTELFKDGHTHKTRHIQGWGTYKRKHTPPAFPLFPESNGDGLTGDDEESLRHSLQVVGAKTKIQVMNLSSCKINFITLVSTRLFSFLI